MHFTSAASRKSKSGRREEEDRMALPGVGVGSEAQLLAVPHAKIGWGHGSEHVGEAGPLCASALCSPSPS